MFTTHDVLSTRVEVGQYYSAVILGFSTYVEVGQANFSTNLQPICVLSTCVDVIPRPLYDADDGRLFSPRVWR